MSLLLSPGITSQLVGSLGTNDAAGHEMVVGMVSVQSGSQPSAGTWLPSSQASAPWRVPSPHVDREVAVTVTVQSASQPSSATALPSSHASAPVIIPSPQYAGAAPNVQLFLHASV